MTIRNLDRLLAPRSVAVIGASDRPGAVGRVVIENVIRGSFKGPVYPVNHKHDAVAGLKCYRRIADLPEPPDLAVIVTPPATVPGLIGELGRKGCKIAVVLTAGLTEASGLRRKMLDAARPHLLRIVGPNILGVLIPHLGLNASFSHLAARPGKLALLSQSGAMATTLIDWAEAEEIGFSHIVSMGDMADVDVGDLVNLLAADPKTGAILMYLESIPAPRKFLSAMRAAARVKPVVVVKPGRHEAAARAAATHTGALASVDRVVDAALRRAGAVRVIDLPDLFAAAETIARFPAMATTRLAVVTNGGGAGVLALDQLVDEGVPVAELSEATIGALDEVLPPTWSRANPVDIIGDAPPGRYRAAIEAVAADGGVDAILVMNCPTGLASPRDAAEAVAGLVEDGRIGGKPVFACWLGEHTAREARAILQRAGVASLDTPVEAARAVGFLGRWTKVQAQLRRVPESRGEPIFGEAEVRAIFEAVAAEGREMLTEPEAKAAIAAYGMKVPETRVVGTPEEAEAAAAALLDTHGAVVVKLLSRAITHKSDVGGVALDLKTAADAAAAAGAMLARVGAMHGDEAVDGFTVQPMVRRSGAVELILGVDRDPIFGPTILFGAGGTAVEVVDDTATGLAPLDEVLAGDLIERTRIARLLAGYRDRPPADRAAIVSALVGLSRLVVDFPCLRGVDVNPLLADEKGAIALDARIEIDPGRIAERGPDPDLAIRPYPSGWERVIADGEARYRVRPIRPADAELYPDFLEKVTAEDIRLRFLAPLTVNTPDMLVRLTQLDYDRDVAFVALDERTGELAAIARFSAEPDHRIAEFGVLVRSDLKGRGLGRMVMGRLLDYARADGIAELHGLILRENRPMLGLAEALGFRLGADPDDPARMRAMLDLRGEPGEARR